MAEKRGKRKAGEISEREKEYAVQAIYCHKAELLEEMNYRLACGRESYGGTVLWVEDIAVVDADVPKKKRWRKNRIFAEEIVNGGRQQELDLAKAAAVLCLALIHSVIECTPEEGLTEGIPFLFDSVIGGPLSAPLFMFAMGIGMAYSGRRTYREYLRRGMEIGAAGYWLNVCRFLIPFLIGYGITGDYEKYIAPLPYRFFGNDILQFACLAMLLTGLLIRLGISDRGMLCLCLGISCLGTCLNGTDLGNAFWNILGGYLIGTEDAAGMVISDFPVMNWLLVPIAGYLFGKKLLHVKDKRLFYGIFSTACFIVTAIYFFTGIRDRRGMFGEGQNCYYHITTADCLAGIMGAIASLGICYAAARHLSKRVMDRVTEISRNINAIYCLQWVLVIYGADLALYILRGTQTLEIFRTLLGGICISVISVWAARYFARYREAVRQGRCGNAKK